MLQVLLLFLFAASSAFTTHRYDAYNLGTHHPITPYSDNIFEYANSNGRRPVQMYEYLKRYDGVVISDGLEGAVGSSDGDRRRVDTPYYYQNPYQWNRQVPWNRVGVTEPAKLYNRFENTNQDVYNPNKENVTNQMYGMTINETQGVVNVPHTSTQSDDVNRSLVINERRITWNNDHHSSSEDNANINTRSINSDNYTNSLNVINRPTKLSNRTVYNNIFIRNQPNNNVNGNINDNTKYGTDTTPDIEVTPRTNVQTTLRRPTDPKAYEDDRWVWSNGEDQALETTTLFDLGDRAAFAGDGCPTGKIKVGSVCVVKD